ncbi:MAG TPA: transcriptional regulator NrdR [Phycisphaerae bacterium]|jgi:transcriptional repressor NrdR
MRCPSCKKLDTDKVIDSRATESGTAVRRRRVCMACNRRFTTKERVESEIRLMVVKKDGTRVPYRRENVLQGVRTACYKRPYPDERLEELVDAVESDLFRDFDREVSSRDIGQIVVRHLRALDKVAYVRFMSVYREYKDVDQFIEEIQDARERAATEAPNQQSLFEEGKP